MGFIVCLTIIMTTQPAMAKIDNDLHDQLIKMAQQKQQIRQSLGKYALGNVPAALQSVATQIDNLHTQTLKEIVALYGWPSKKRIGIKGIHAIFFLIQHSQDLVFQQDMLPFVIQSYIDKDGIAGQDVAQFTDNVSIKLGKKQVFGTRAEFLNGKVIFTPIENEASVDLLRAQMDMPPLAEYKTTLEVFYGIRNHH